MLAGWRCPEKDQLGLTAGNSSIPPRSAVCKLHEMPNHVAEKADVVLMSHRNPFYSICSRKLEKMWCKATPFYNGKYVKENDPLYNKAKRACLSGNEEEEVRTQCQFLMGLQADIYARREEFNNTVAYDVPLEAWHNDAKSQIKKVAKAIGICDNAVNDSPLIEFIYRMGLYLGAKGSHLKDQGITKMHTVHSNEERSHMCTNIRAGIAASEECEKWTKHNGSSVGNSVLELLQSCRVSKRDCGIRCLSGHWYDKPQSGGYTRDYKLAPGVAKCSRLKIGV